MTLYTDKNGDEVRVPHRNLGKKPVKKRLLVVRCICGAEILLIPNVKLMSEAIEAHVEEHIKNIVDPQEAEKEAERIRDDLTIKVLETAAQA